LPPFAAHRSEGLVGSLRSERHRRLGAKFKRLRAHLGAPKAITAMAHTLARLVYRMLKYGQDYVDKGMEFYQQRYQKQQINWMQKKAKDLGLVITLKAAPAAK
jgi:transposase